MKNETALFFLISFWICMHPCFPSFAQTGTRKNYPQNYFRNPLDIPMTLSGNFGELRPNHFHMGLDLKTMRVENLPVHAAADGYIARIKIEPGGFGRAIYINHPNGFTTLYAHLNNFVPALDAYVKEQQYNQESWNVFLDVAPGLFPVKKGNLIAYSGNTGGSQAPHLHFEMRRTVDDVNLNPLLFGLPLEDNIKPGILRLALYDRNKSTYEQSPKMVTIKKTATGYITIPALITSNTNKVSFAITAFDTHTGSASPNGIYEALLYEDGELVAGFQMDNISYNQTRYINAHIDYKTKANGGPFLQYLTQLPGYLNSIYLKGKDDGVIDIKDATVHDIRIEVKDANGNTSILNSAIQYKGPNPTRAPAAGKKFYPLMLDVFEESDCEYFMGENCLYDSVQLKYTRGLSSNPAVISAIHTIGASYIPLQEPFMVRIKPLQPIPGDKTHAVVMQRFSGLKKDISKVAWENGWASGRFREFGSFQLVADNEPPVIIPVGFINGSNLSKASGIVFTIRDNMESFKNFRAELDGKWLRFTNDKGKTFIYRFDEMCPPGEHQLKISVEDEAGNVTEKVYSFTR